jgi:hypothetical protein
MNDIVQEKLIEILTKFGPQVIKNSRQCEGLLRDYCGEHKRAVNILVLALKEGIPSDLLSAPTGLPQEIITNRLTQRLVDNLAMGELAASWAVACWAKALGIIINNPSMTPLQKVKKGSAKRENLIQ